MNKKKIVFSLFTMVLIIISFISIKYYINEPNNYVYKYDVEINNNLDTFFYIHIPVLINIDGVDKNFIENMKIIKGNPKYSLINTPYGKALNVSGINDISISTEIITFPAPDYVLSLRNTTENRKFHDFFEGQYWIYFYNDITNKSFQIEIKLICNYENGGGYGDFIIEGEIIKNGWNLLSGYEHNAVY